MNLLNMRLNSDSNAMIMIAIIALTPTILKADSGSSADPKACIDSSITVGQRIIWTLFRDTSKAPQESLCEKILFKRRIYSEGDNHYLSTDNDDRDYRLHNHENGKTAKSVGNYAPRNETVNQPFVEQYHTTTKSRSVKIREEKIDTVDGFETIEP